MEERNTLGILVDTGLSIEKTRVRLQIRQSHLKLQKRKDPTVDALLEDVASLEKSIDKKVTVLLKEHPAYVWFSQIKGIGNENIGKVVGLVDIEKAYTISSLWKFAGYSVENGKAPKKEKGVKLEYNAQLRTMCWRLASSLLRSKGSYYKYYLSQKERYQQRFINEGYSIVKAAQIKKKGKYISEGHIHNMALRKMIKLFLSHLWLVWREEVGLTVTNPYVIDNLKHDSFIKPYEMVDKVRAAKKPKNKKRTKTSE